ncbi:MAG TPA: efflux RND transporter periplasmic adaptor subunit [Steroidobacteraceae bacterium]|nr:efflux RND transporter periplasmic adaptor subunit [Steroidobacteraceae bacterium]
MNRTLVLLVMLVTTACGKSDQHVHDERERGPHNGRMLERDGFAVELAIYETGIPPEYRVWFYQDDKPLPPDAATVEVELQRLGGKRDHFTFRPEGEFLRGSGVVEEPHSFDVTVRAQRAGKSFEWQFDSYEGRTTIAADTAQSMGISTSAAGPAVLKEQLTLSGVIQADPSLVSRVRARYAGIVREVAAQPWANVARGALLARVQSNESLQNYAIEAPIGGVIVEHRAQVGEATGEEPLFTIIDLSRVWVELDVFQNDLARIADGQAVEIFDLDGRRLADGRVSRIAPLAIHGSQSVRARVVLDNASGMLRPGQFVSGRVTVGESKAALAVEKAGLQRFRDFDVVFEQVGDTYEVRMLELGRADATRVEVLGGLEAGARYVTRNSYLIKADIEKSGASHDH